MWSDSIFSFNDRAKLNLLARALEAMYIDGGAGIESVVRSPVTFLGSPGDGAQAMVRTWITTLEGEKIVFIEGTIATSQLLVQYLGYLDSMERPSGGRVNSVYEEIAEQLYLATPLDVGLLVGHSMGGAVASLAATKYPTPRRWVSFGSPRNVTEPNKGLIGRNYAYIHDPVPYVPPDGTGGFKWDHEGNNLWTWNRFGNLTLTLRRLRSSATYLDVLVSSGALRYHAIGWYVTLTSEGTPAAQPPIPGPPPGGPASPGGPGGRGMLVRFDVKARYHGMPAGNGLWYYISDAAVPLADIAAAFQAKWRAWIIPRVSNHLSVERIVASKMSGVIFSPATEENPEGFSKHRVRYSSRLILPGGTPADTGARAGAALASFNAVGFIKSALQYKLGSAGTEIPLVNPPMGFMRVAGIMESDTDPVNDNELEAAAMGLWKESGEALVNIPVAGAGATLQMAIVTTDVGRGEILTGEPPVADYAYAIVDNVSVSKYLTSQVSRKQGNS